MRVLVLDADGRPVEEIHPGQARRELALGRMTVAQQSPFVVQRVAAGKGFIVETSRLAAAQSRLTANRLGQSFNNYFADREDGDVWVQNLSSMQVSLEIDDGSGDAKGFMLPPTPDPVNLTESFSFEALKKSSSLRGMASKRYQGRAVLALLDEAQVEAYYANKAIMMGARQPDGAPDLGAALEAAAKTRRSLTTREVEGENISASGQVQFAPPKSAMELVSMDLSNRGIDGVTMGPDGQVQLQRSAAAPGERGPIVRMAEVVNPRVLHLCQQVSMQLAAHERMPADQFFGALQALEPSLTVEDYQHIEAHGTYRTVKRWAREKIAQFASAEDGVEDNLSLAGQALVGASLRASEDPNNVLAAAAAEARSAPQYQGPTGFANGPAWLGQAASPETGPGILGPDGRPT